MNKTTLAALAAVSMLVALLSVADADILVDHLQEISVTIVANHAQGSGTIVIRNGDTYVWTAGHVVQGCRRVVSLKDDKGKETKDVLWDEVMVVRTVVQDGKILGNVIGKSKVVKYSGPDHGRDLALLKMDVPTISSSSAHFYLESTIPEVGTPLYHIGSFLGLFGADSLSEGIVSFVGRVYETKLYDQYSFTAFPGSSGGGAYLKKDGRYVGMVVRQTSPTFNLIVPVREMISWSKSNGIYWALDPNVPVTDIKEIENPDEEDTEPSEALFRSLHLLRTIPFSGDDYGY